MKCVVQHSQNSTENNFHTVRQRAPEQFQLFFVGRQHPNMMDDNCSFVMLIPMYSTKICICGNFIHCTTHQIFCQVYKQRCKYEKYIGTNSQWEKRENGISWACANKIIFVNLPFCSMAISKTKKWHKIDITKLKKESFQWNDCAISISWKDSSRFLYYFDVLLELNNFVRRLWDETLNSCYLHTSAHIEENLLLSAIYMLPQLQFLKIDK